MEAITVDQLFQCGIFSEFGLGAYLGARNLSPAEARRSNEKGLDLLAACGFVPTCQTPMGCPDCGVNMQTAVDRRCSLGWRYVCAPCRRKFSPVGNTLLDGVNLEDLGADTIVKLAFHWLTEVPQVRFRDQLCSQDTSVTWYGLFHDVSNKIAWHNFKVAGEANSLKLYKKHGGEWMYRKNVLRNLPDLGSKFRRLLSDCGRVYPGIGKVAMSDDYLTCQCHECVVQKPVHPL